MRPTILLKLARKTPILLTDDGENVMPDEVYGDLARLLQKMDQEYLNPGAVTLSIGRSPVLVSTGAELLGWPVYNVPLSEMESYPQLTDQQKEAAFDIVDNYLPAFERLANKNFYLMDTISDWEKLFHTYKFFSAYMESRKLKNRLDVLALPYKQVDPPALPQKSEHIHVINLSTKFPALAKKMRDPERTTDRFAKFGWNGIRNLGKKLPRPNNLLLKKVLAHRMLRDPNFKDKVQIGDVVFGNFQSGHNKMVRRKPGRI